MAIKKSQPIFKLIKLAAVISILSGCSIAPKHIDNKTQLNNTYKNLHEVINTQKPINHTVSLTEAIARTLKYNLDHRVENSKLMIESGNLKAAYLEMLPQLNMDVDYSFRNNDLVQNLVDNNGHVTDGDQSYTPREILSQSYGLQWNLLDLGLSYTRAQQQANKVMIFDEERRKITQKIIQEVISSYWKAWTAQSMKSLLEDFKKKAEVALEMSKKSSKNKSNNKQVELDYQHELIKYIANYI